MSNRIEFWFKDRYNLYLRLPVNPESIEIDSPFSINTIDVVSLGEVPIPGERGLKTISFSSFFPEHYNESYCEYEDFPKPSEWVKQIEEWRDTRFNIRIIVTGTEISIPVFVSEFTIEPERAGSPGDIYYSISLTEFKAPQVRIIEEKKKVTAKPARPPAPKPKPKTYTVVRGDSLWKIAAKPSIYGKGADWRKIYNANKGVVGKNPNLIYPGQKLVIP